MRLRPIIEELRRECPVFENRVFGLVQYAQFAESTNTGFPCAFVIPITEEAQDPRLQTRYLQEVAFTFRVIVVVPNTADERGLDSWDRFDSIRAQVLRAIAGSDDPSQSDFIAYQGLAIQEMNRAFLAVSMDFKVTLEIMDDEVRHGLDIERLGRFKQMNVTIDASGDGLHEAHFQINLKD